MSPTRAMSPGDLAVGQFVTILEAIEEKDDAFEKADVIVMPDPRSRRSSLTGVPLRVLAIDLPFVLAQVEGGDKFSLDTRLHRLMELKPEFVQAFASPEPERNPQFAQLVAAHSNLMVCVQQYVIPTLKRMEAANTPTPRPWWKFWN